MYFVGANNYIYCSNNPVNFIDPLGLSDNDEKKWYEKAWEKTKDAAAIGGAGIQGGLEGLGNEAIGVAKLLKGGTYDMGKILHDSSIGQFTGERTSDWGQYVDSEISSGRSALGLTGEYLKNVSGVGFGENITNSAIKGYETGDYSEFSQSMGQAAFMAGTTAKSMQGAKSGSTTQTKVQTEKGGGVVQKTTLPAPGEDLYVGSYGKSYRANIKSGLQDSHTPHHAVQDAVSSTSHSRGITINIRKDIHVQTRTYGKKIDLGSPRKNLAADALDIRRLLHKAGYEPALVRQQLQELIRQNKATGGFSK